MDDLMEKAVVVCRTAESVVEEDAAVEELEGNRSARFTASVAEDGEAELRDEYSWFIDFDEAFWKGFGFSSGRAQHTLIWSKWSVILNRPKIKFSGFFET